MSINAHVIRPYLVADLTGDQKEFQVLQSFLSSPVFDVNALKRICREHNLVIQNKKSDLANTITVAALRSSDIRKSIIDTMFDSSKGWVSIKAGSTGTCFEGENPLELVTTDGDTKWYGPVRYSKDEGASWYIRPVFEEHWERLEESDKPVQSKIRWLVFARVGKAVASLHWEGFTYTSGVDLVEKANMQYPYWRQIPTLFKELEQLLNAELSEVELHELMLGRLWERYRQSEGHNWTHNRVRAESGGVFLSARSSGRSTAIELEMAGINNLANKIRRSIQLEIERQYGRSLPLPTILDEVIVDTLVKNLGTLSYECEIETVAGERLFRGHSYFGFKDVGSSPDVFPHINLYVGYRPYLEQCWFLFEQLGIE